MGEDVSVGLLGGSQTKSGVPIEHLDHRYIKECKNGKELEKILKVLNSGEEGIYPELIEFTEKRLEEVNPKSKSLRKEIPIQTYHDLTASEEKAITNDLEEWMTNISEADKSLKKEGMANALGNDDLPPIRSAGNNEVPVSKEQKNIIDIREKKPALPRDFHEWERFDADKEIEALDKQEEEERKKKQEQAKLMNKSAVSSSLDLKGKSETERRVLANKEKEKGNEAFQSGNYSEAFTYYCRSIEMDPNGTAVYNNRALTEIKLEKFQEAVDDCNRVISAEPNNVKAYLRRSIAHRSQGLKEKATEDLYRVLSIEPNNKRAKQLLGEMKKNESEDKEPTKAATTQDTGNSSHNSAQDEGTPIDNHNSAVTGQTSTTTSKGKRLKIVDVESENDTETSVNLGSASCTDNTIEPPLAQQIEFNDKTKESENFHSVEKPQEEKLPELPGLVIKAQGEGTKLFKLGRYAEAAEKFTQGVDILQKDKLLYQAALGSLLCNRGSCLMKIGDCAGCVADCTSALKLLPGDFRSLLKRAQAYETSEKYTKAWCDYQMALSLQSHHQKALQGNLRVSKHLENLYGQNWKDRVSPTSSSGITDSQASTLNGQLTNSIAPQHDSLPQPTHASNTIGSAVTPLPSPQVDTSGDTSSVPHPSPVTDACTVESQTSSDSIVDPAVRFAQCKEEGNALVKQNRYEEAVACYSECIGVEPENVAVYTNRALCYLRLNQYNLAIDDTTEALRLQPNNVKALFRRALAKKALSQYDSAARDLFELQKIEPKNAVAKKELDVVLEMCRKERRESAEKTTKSKKKKKKGGSKLEKEKLEASQENGAPKWKRITIKDVQNDDEDDERPPQKEQFSSNTKPPNEVFVNQTEATKPVKVVKKTAYDFFQAWSAVKKGDTKCYADLLRHTETTRLPKVLSNKLDASMLNSIIAALSQEFVPQGEEKLACDILEQLSRVQRFDMVLLFMSEKEKDDLAELFCNLQAGRSKQIFATSGEFERLRSKYKL